MPHNAISFDFGHYWMFFHAFKFIESIFISLSLHCIEIQIIYNYAQSLQISKRFQIMLRWLLQLIILTTNIFSFTFENSIEVNCIFHVFSEVLSHISIKRNISSRRIHYCSMVTLQSYRETFFINWWATLECHLRIACSTKSKQSPVDVVTNLIVVLFQQLIHFCVIWIKIMQMICQWLILFEIDYNDYLIHEF